MKKWIFMTGSVISFCSYYFLGTTAGATTYEHLFDESVDVVKSRLVEKIEPFIGIEKAKPLIVSDEIKSQINMPVWGEDSFYKAKVSLKEITKNHKESFYCGCEIKYETNSKLVPDFSKCGFTYRKNKERASRMEAEHIVPISWYGHNLKCWQEGGRKNCQKTSKLFNLAEADLVNLQYAIGEVNGDRNYYRYGIWKGGEGQYGACDAKVDFENKRFQPREELWGWIGRVHLYMKKKYGLQISNSQERMMNIWASMAPTDWECEYNDILKKRYGADAGNPYSTYACQKMDEYKAKLKTQK